VSGATTRFLYDGANLIGEYNAAGALLRRYVQGPGLDAPLVRYDGTGTSNRRWLITPGSCLWQAQERELARLGHGRDQCLRRGRPDQHL
jgi:hypothetical protein